MDDNINVALPSTEDLFLPAVGTPTAIYEMSGGDDDLDKQAGSGDSGQKHPRSKPKQGGGNDTGNKKPG